MKKCFKLITNLIPVLILMISVTQPVRADSSDVPTDSSSASTEPQVSPEYQSVPPGYQPVPPHSANESPGLVPPAEIEPYPNLVKYECLANNTACTVFYEINSNPHIAQDDAMRSCFSFGLPCRPLGCHRLP